MAIEQTVDEIQSAMISDIAAEPDLVYTDNNSVTQTITNNTSKRARWRLWTWVVAAAIATLEILMDTEQAQSEALVAIAIPETSSWLIQQIFQFQYSVLNPQIIQLINLVPQYPVIDPTLQIVSRASTTTTSSNQVLIKVATQNPPAAMNEDQVSALQDFVNTIGTPGVSYFVSSAVSDKIRIEAIIYFQGQFAGVIQNNVITALNNYLAGLSTQANFNGTVKVSDIENIIKNVTGVIDVILVNVQARADGVPLADAQYLVQAQTLISRLFPTVAGYIVQETTTGNTFADTLTFNATTI